MTDDRTFPVPLASDEEIAAFIARYGRPYDPETDDYLQLTKGNRREEPRTAHQLIQSDSVRHCLRLVCPALFGTSKSNRRQS